MELVTDATTEAAYTAFSNGLKNLISTSTYDRTHTSKACLICDHLLEWNEDGYLPKTRLKALRTLFYGQTVRNRLSTEGLILTDSVYRQLKKYYSYKGKGHESWMSNMFLSPRGVFHASNGFNCCGCCCKILGSSMKPCRVKLPKYAIANGAIIGNAPSELTSLNDVELALVSKARIDKHVFTFYGGAHKSMRGWHNLYENDVEHIAGALQQIETFSGDSNTIACILQGPFTAYQQSKVREQVMIRPQKILKSMKWLKRNNHLYKTLHIPTVEELPEPIIIDDSNLVESENTQIESRFEYTVVFPATEEIDTTNGGNMTQDAFKCQVLQNMDRSNTVSVYSRSTQNRLKDYEGDNLLRTFPLQFPYGLGRVQMFETSSNKKRAINVQLDYISHLQCMSIRHMHRGDFVLVLHNMFERHKAISIAYLRCVHKVGNDTIGEHFGNMTVAQLERAINRAQSNLPIQDRTAGQFLSSIDAVCKNMAHTNDAAKGARLKLFANMVRFGRASVFFTVTPDDSNCFRIQVYVTSKCRDPPTCSDDCTKIDADFESSHKIRQEYPGLCAFDYDQITELLIYHILGWNQAEQQPKLGGGVFGVLDAWSHSIEEQGRKTLHGHYILWVREWSTLLLGLRSDDSSTREKAAEQLSRYIDTVLSTKLFAGCSSIIHNAYDHKCKNQQLPVICDDQSIRNLRYKHGETSFGRDNFLKCPDCGRLFNMGTLINNVLVKWFGSELNLEKKLKLVVKRCGAQIDIPSANSSRMTMQKFMVHALCNLHASSHVQSCFKNGFECRNKIPDRPCSETMVHFDTENPITWWSWNGTFKKSPSFYAEPARHDFDIFMNRYHSQLSTILGSNTNVQCGIDRGHMFYVSLYASKRTQQEDRYAYAQVSKTLYARFRHQHEAQNNPESSIGMVQAPTPAGEGLMRLISGVLANTSALVVSAPMAWFIMRKGSRFMFSNDFGYIGLDAILGRMMHSRLDVKDNSTFLVNKVNDYIFRPKELENVNLYDFVARFDVKYISKKDGVDTMRFVGEHPQSEFRCVVNCQNDRTPLVNYRDFPDSEAFGGNILDPSLTPTIITEQYAKAALCLFNPFRGLEMFTAPATGFSFTKYFRIMVRAEHISQTSLCRLQNIQDCRNMMKSGRQKDTLERTTEPLPDPIRSKLRNDDKTDEELEARIENALTELISQLDADNNLGIIEAPDGSPFLSLTELRGNGSDQCGYESIAQPSVNQSSCLYEIGVDNTNNPDETNQNNVTFSPKIVSKAGLIQLAIRSVKRNVEAITELSHINPNGTVQSIQEWARIAFQDRATRIIDQTQKRSFEVIVSAFIMTFHDEAERNVDTTGTVEPYNRHYYVKLRSSLKKLSGRRNGDRQLIMFLTGAGGSGKTEIINSVLAYTKGFCMQMKYVFDKRLIVITAMSGVAATLINGETIHSAAKLNCEKITVEHQKEWANTRMLIIDEISFASSTDLLKLNESLRKLKQVHDKYGGLHIVFSGDFSQLEPVNGTPLYHQPDFAPWHDWINCFIELTGQHRFKLNPEFGDVMQRLHDGCPTTEDIALLNSRVINGDHPDAPTDADLPNNLAYAVYRNVDRVAINNGIFAEHVKSTHSIDKTVPPPAHTLIIRSDDLTWHSNGNQFSRSARLILWSQCKDTDITVGRKQNKKYADPFLKLYENIPLMYTENSNVPNGEANGTLCRLIKINLKDGTTENDFDLMNIDGFWVRTIDASKVDYLLCQIDGTDKQLKVRAQTNQCTINMPIAIIPGNKKHPVVATMNRFPVLTNHATTGHKLQGQTKENLFISAWYYGKNWPYVVMSRVKQLSGLFLRTAIDPEHDFSLDPLLVRMLNYMKQKVPLPYETD